MKYFDWEEEKNRKLKEERDISFEEVVIAIEEGRHIDTIDHPNQEKYPGQKIIIVEINRYAYTIPYVEDEDKIFFKTIIPSRSATKKYIIEKD